MKKLNADRVRRVVLTHLAHPSAPVDLAEVETFVRWLSLQALLVAAVIGGCWLAGHVDAHALNVVSGF